MTASPATSKRKLIGFGIVVLLVLSLPITGKAGMLAAFILGAALLGVPLFAIITGVTFLCFILWADYPWQNVWVFFPAPEERNDMRQFSVLMERIRSLADNPNLLAIPLFIMSGSVMSRGQISARLIDFARALVGWLPGGLAVSAVLACMFFAAISGSSPATVVAIGAMMAPTMIEQGYSERFSHGLVTSAGSLGILIPPSIPMILYPIVFQGAVINLETLFASGFGPGFVIGGILMAFSVVNGLRNKATRDPFSLARLKAAVTNGFWALLFPLLILGGIYSGVFIALEAAAVSVVYAIAVEVLIHRAIKLSDVPKVVQETGVFLGSLLVIMVAALAFSEFLEGEQIPRAAVEQIQALHLEPIMFLLIVNLLLLVVGMFMDILSAMFIFVPLLAPIAISMGVDPIHFGIIFIVNLEIGYLTPPVGLNLFVSSTLFNRPLGHIIRAVLPFIGLMMLGLVIITYVPALSVGLGNWIMGNEPIATPAPVPSPEDGEGEPAPTPRPREGVQTLEEMMRESEGGSGPSGRVQTLEEMMEEAERDGAEAPAPAPAPAPRDPGRVQTLEEMMQEVEQQAP